MPGAIAGYTAASYGNANGGIAMTTKTGLALAVLVCAAPCFAAGLTLTPQNNLETQGLTVNVYQMKFHPVFFDEKNAGLQLILHDERIATDGEVRLNPTPEQWDPIPTLVGREKGKVPNQVVVKSGYPAHKMAYKLVVTAEGDGGFRISVDLDKPVPKDLIGKAGFNLDFVPTSYFGKSFLMGEAPGLFPRIPLGPMAKDGSGDPLPLAEGAKTLTLSPEDALTRVTIASDTAPLMLFDARNRAQNGWFVVRALIPAGKTKGALVWHVKPNLVKGWTRTPVVSFNQAGYTPERTKVAVIEMDAKFTPPAEASLIRLEADGSRQSVLTAKIKPWGNWTRYAYATFDFSSVKQPGVYAIAFAGRTTNPFRIAPDAYAKIWQPSLDTYLAEQMDHMAIREQYRVWSGLSHMDDARQAPASYVHFDGYKMGPDLDSPFKPGEHIPGLNVGGWQDAGDYDIETPSNALVVRDLVMAKERFGLDWDETSIDEAAHAVEIRKPDGVNDAQQQIRHGALQLLAQYKVFGHAISGIVDPTLKQYTHLGDSGSQTDGRIYDPKLGPNEISGNNSGKTDDRWAFTPDAPGTDLFAAAGLAAAARALEASDPKLAAECLAAAKAMWANQQDGKAQPRMNRPDRAGWMEGALDLANVSATVELVLATRGDAVYTAKLKTLMPVITQRFEFLGGTAVRALPYMDEAYRSALHAATKEGLPKLEAELAKTPFGVPVWLGTWAGSAQVAMFGATMYDLHKAFPDLIGTQYTLDALDFLLGRHPVHNLSLVTGVGAASKQIMYGHNRADYSFVPGALVPGVLVIQPDFPEQKTEWPFLWFENEATVGSAAAYIVAANAAIAALKE
jgi:hypothetical protein